MQCPGCGIGINIDTNRLANAAEEMHRAVEKVPPEITIKFAKRQASIYEVPISYAGRTYEEGKKITWKDGVQALWCIIRYKLGD